MMRQRIILLLEDSADDAYFFQRYAAKWEHPVDVRVARNGREAIAYLEGTGEFSDRSRHPLPDIIITDNQMPSVTGAEFLDWLRNNPQHRVYPTIFLSGAAPQKDVNTAYRELGVQSFIFKPRESKDLERAVRLILDYWSLCALPERGKSNAVDRPDPEVKANAAPN